MSKEKIFRQCIFLRGTTKTTGWLEEDNAIIGRKVSLKNKKGIWEIKHVGPLQLTQEAVIREQDAHKNQRDASDI